MNKDTDATRREVRAALQHRRTHRLARYEDEAGRRHELVALRTRTGVVVCDRTQRHPRQPIGCVAVLAPTEVGSVGAIVEEYLRWAPLSDQMGIREVSPEDVAGESREGGWRNSEPARRWEELRREMTIACGESLDQRPKRKRPKRRGALAA